MANEFFSNCDECIDHLSSCDRQMTGEHMQGGAANCTTSDKQVNAAKRSKPGAAKEKVVKLTEHMDTDGMEKVDVWAETY